jgi:hypothetical protein
MKDSIFCTLCTHRAITHSVFCSKGRTILSSFIVYRVLFLVSHKLTYIIECSLLLCTWNNFNCSNSKTYISIMILFPTYDHFCPVPWKNVILPVYTFVSLYLTLMIIACPIPLIPPKVFYFPTLCIWSRITLYICSRIT